MTTGETRPHTGFDEMDVQELQAFIDSSEKVQKNKDIDYEMLQKLEKRSAKSYLQKTGVFSAGELKELAENKYIEVDKKKANLNTPVNPVSKIDLNVKNPEKFILPPNMKLFLFFKPKGLICSKVDSMKLKRPTIFDYIKRVHNISDELYCVVR